MELPSDSVQEKISKGKEVPEKYVQQINGVDPQEVVTDNTCLPLVDIPIIDLGLLMNLPINDIHHELDKFSSALTTWGCFQVINHGMTLEFLDKVREIAREFFELPLEEKKKYSREANRTEGYGNDMFFKENQKLDWTDRLYLTIYPQDQQRHKFWPENPQAFRGVLQDYALNLKMISEALLKAMARSLKLEDNCFHDQYGEEAKIRARFNYYPPCSRPDLVLGLKAHTDGSAITFVLQDKDVEGLQFFKDNQWYRVPIIPEALVINVGDLVEISSNGIFKSPIHRAVTNTKKERISLAVFYLAEQDSEIGPFKELINESRPRLYKNFINYNNSYFKYYQQGKRLIEEAKLQSHQSDQ